MTSTSAPSGALVPCIVVSLFYILLTLFLAEILRRLCRSLVPHGLLKTAILEFIAAAELCGCSFELVIIADHYGVPAYAVCLFLLTIRFSAKWGPDDVTACPYVHFEAGLQGRMGLVEVVVRTAAEVAGGLAVFRYVQMLWALEFAETHVGRPHSSSFNQCSSDLQVPLMYGALIEGGATLFCRLTSKVLSEGNTRHASAIESFVGTSLVVAAFNYSGGYYNPVLATSLKYGCRNHPLSEHVAVYWVGASLGAVLSIYTYPLVKGVFLGGGDKAKKED